MKEWKKALWTIAVGLLLFMPFVIREHKAQVADEASHAWFTGFSADPNFPYAVVVVVEHGGGGSDVAVPIASKIMKDLKNSL